MKAALLLARLLLLTFSTAVWILVLIYGWGLSPVSWPWIIGGAVWSFLTVMAATVFVEIERAMR